jgi:hypothetical protein
MVIVIGDDAPDPAYYTNELFVDEEIPADGSEGAFNEEDSSGTGAEDPTSGD